MSNLAKDVVNAGIGVADSVKEVFETASTDIQKALDELKTKGAAESVKEVFSTTTTDLQKTLDELKNKGEANQQDFAAKARELATTADQKLGELNGKIEEQAQKLQQLWNENLESLKSNKTVEELKVKVDEFLKSFNEKSATPEEIISSQEKSTKKKAG